MTKTERLAVCLVFFAVFAAGCSGNNIGEPSTTTQSQSAGSTTPAETQPLPPGTPTADPLPEPQGGRWTVRAEGGPSGPGCPGALVRTNTGTRFITYTIDVQNAGTEDWDTIAIGHYSDDAGCNPTTDGAVPLEIKGKSDFKAGTSGTFQVIFDTWRIPCEGSAQPDVQAFTRENRRPIESMLFVAEVIRAAPAPNCLPPPPPPPPKASVSVGAICVAASGSFTTNIAIASMTNVAKVFVDGPGANDLNFTANGMQNVPWVVGTYNWTATAAAGAVFDNGLATTTGTVKVVDCSTTSATCTVINPSLVVTSNTQSPGNLVNNVVLSVGWTGAGTGTLNWGDGSAITAVTSPSTPSHNFARGEADRTFTITLTVTELGVSCPKTVTITVPKIPPPTCEVQNPPSFTVNFPVISNATASNKVVTNAVGVNEVISGQAVVKNDGLWEFFLYAGLTQADYNTDSPEFIKDSDTLTLACLGSGTLNVSYMWTGHAANYWWVVLKRNGVTVFKSDVRIKQ